jgi:hypothetical protein
VVADPSLIEAPSEFEMIGGKRFALWKRKLPQEFKGFSLHFYVVTLILVLVLLAWAGYVYGQTELGNNTPVKVFGIGLLASFYCLPVGMLIARKMSRRSVLPTPRPKVPPTTPDTAIPCVAAMKGDNLGLGRSVGWLWLEQGALCFKGDGFDFILRRKDFKRKAGSGIKQGIPMFLAPGKGIPGTALFLQAAYYGPSGTTPAPAEWDRTKSELESFEQSEADFDPLFPPLRSGFMPIPAIPVLKGFAVAGLFLFVVLLSVPLFVPLPMRDSPFLFAARGSLYMPVLGLSALQGTIIRWAREKSIKKAKLRGTNLG